MSKLMSGGVLAGKKTYVTGALAIFSAAASYLVGELSLADAIQTIVPAVMLMTVRHGVTTELKK